MASENNEQTDDANSETPAPPMNRAERRALEHKKKGGAANSSPGGFGNQGSRPASGTFSAGPGKTRLPRTGHK
jgi:hypothetical protein